MQLFIQHSKSISVPYLNNIITEINRVAKKIPPTFPVTEADILIVVAETLLPVTGHSQYQNTITFMINPLHKWKDIKKEIPGTLYHELHHLARDMSVGYGKTLQDAVIAEGLALAYEEEMGCDISQFITMSTKTMQRVQEEFKKERLLKNYYYEKWFYKTPNFPQWAGYALGYRIVQSYIQKTGIKPSVLHDARTRSIMGGNF